MGWWDCGIMGGDPAWDAADCFDAMTRPDPPESLIPAEDDGRFMLMNAPDNWEDAERALVRYRFAAVGGFASALAQLLATRYSESYTTADDRGIATQVLGLLAISCGAPLSSADRQVVIAACAQDAWASGRADRRGCCDALEALIQEYQDGEPVTVPQCRLFDRFLAAFSPAEVAE